MSSIIEDLIARKIFNNRGDETIEVDVITTGGFGRVGAPAGKSRGKAEVSYYPQGGVEQAIKKIDDLIAPELAGLNADFQQEIDDTLHEIDGTSDFKNIGGNTAFAISLANAEAAANSHGLLLFQFLGGSSANTLPYPLGNCISGGQHARGKAPSIQEYLALPHGAESFLEAQTANTLIHKRIGDSLKKKITSFNGGKSDEGAWIANVTTDDAFEIMARTCEEVGNELDFECGFGIDVAASSFWKPKEQKYMYENGDKKRDTAEQLEYMLELIEKYHLTYIEDPFHEDDFDSFAELTRKSKNCLICGDDLFTTNTERLNNGIKINAGNAIIIKVNQIGTLTDAAETIEMAQRNGYDAVVSHRSGDTCDWHIAHLAVAYKCPVIKTGVVEGARIAKLNELIRIEHFLGSRAKMAALNVC
ncbi:MAG: enolase C-terminal domain-like protein [Candidatus Bathyarchaeota archaeon]|nr:enolase C-terminal domain-like protein [Candidatus Bathyarchaeota archaeon]MDD4325063.1 enolase C-terminal domain-like protein [Candidatus Bathyarchaeota archaeon]MDI9576771.1 enolase C-terminal domain-like protein [Thermoproteota archaeon]MDT8781466.1 phosphopyruvate hydratase [Candidatus Bathyarchaeota archaeon]NLD66970.1 phosphopyruvate hydratase [Thermoproteota archaeon]